MADAMVVGAESPEIALLRACARRQAQEVGGRAADFPNPGNVNWDALVALARTQGVVDLLLAPLSASGLNVPERILSELEQRSIGVAGLNLNRVTQLVEVLQLLEEHRIEALTFKGPALTQRLYGHLGSRASNDIDILVHPRDILRVRPLLLNQGYRLPDRPPRRGGSLLYGLTPSLGRDDTLLPGESWQTSVDVHAAFAYWTVGIRLDVVGMFQRSTTIDIAGQTLRTLSPRDQMLVLAVHGMMHGWFALRLVCDVDAMVPHIDDWSGLLEEAERARMSRALLVAMLLAEHLLGTRLPSVVAERAVHDEAAGDIVRRAVLRMLDPEVAQTSWSHHPWLLSFLDTRRRRFGYHARNVVERVILRWPWDEWLGRRRAGQS